MSSALAKLTAIYAGLGPGRMPEEKLRAAEAEYLKYRHAYNSAAALVEALKTKPAV